MPSPPIHSEQYQTIPLSSINLQDDEFRITTREDVDELSTSIQQTGLISPPLLIETSSGHSIVSGFRRVSACLNLGWHEIIARILVPKPDHFDCLRIAIADNALQRPLNLIETSRALHKLSLLLSQLEQLAAVTAAPDQQGHLRSAIRLCLQHLTTIP